jgi:imidazole glycerol phosphate synthase subunit HisF
MSDAAAGVTLNGLRCNKCDEHIMKQYQSVVRPIVCCRGLDVYTGENFFKQKKAGNLLKVLARHQVGGATGAIVYSLDGLLHYDIATEICSLGLELTIGGGIEDMDDAGQMLRAGAAGIALNSSLTESDLLEEASAKWGNVSAVIDVENGIVMREKRLLQMISVSPSVWAHRLQTRGASEIILQSVDRESTLKGYEHGLIRSVADAVRIPVCAVGGCNGLDDAVQGYFYSGAGSLGIGRLFSEGLLRPGDVASELMNKGFTCAS